MFVYVDEYEPPRKSEILQFRSIEKDIFYNGLEQWLQYLNQKGDVLLNIVCEDGYVAIVRIKDCDYD